MIRYFWGIDCGSTAIKVVVCDDKGKCLGRNRVKTLFPLEDYVLKAIGGVSNNLTPFSEKGSGVKEGHAVTVTGYGRHHFSSAGNRLTEIKAHFLGVSHRLGLKGRYVLVDIGGQDSKVIHVKDEEIEKFAINRKCAAGTGAFIEEVARRLELKLEDLSNISKTHDKTIVLNSFCTVFAAQEALRILMSGEKVGNLIHALYESVAKRVLEMAPLEGETVVFSGGVGAYHPALIDIFSLGLPGKKMVVAPDAEYCGAFGAAIYGVEKSSADR